MNKTGILSMLLMAFLVVVLYQNCGKGFQAHNDLMNEISDASTSDLSLPPLGTVNPPDAPEIITKGLSDRLVFSKREGIDAEIEVSDPSNLKFEWLVNGESFVTAAPRLNIKAVGQLDISVVVTDVAGKTSSSRAVLSVSKFAVIDGKLNYLAYTKTYVVVPEADVSTLELVGVNTVADSTQVYNISSTTLSTYKVTNPLTTRELSPNYLTFDGVVYFKGTVIPNAMADTFAVIDDTGYGKDKTRVFCKTAEIVSADPQSFDLPFKGIPNFARDKFNLFSGCAPLRTYDLAAFSIVKSEYVNPKGSKGFLNISGKLYFVSTAKSAGSLEIASKVEFVEVPFTPAEGQQLKVVGEAFLGTYLTDSPSIISERQVVTDGSSYAIFKYVSSTNSSELILLKSSVQVDVPSFAFSQRPIYMDKDRVYVANTVSGTFELLPNAQASNFRSVGTGLFQSGAYLYQIDSKGTWKETSAGDAGELALIAGRLYKDSKQVYFSQPAGGLKVVEGANVATFVSVGRGLYKDATQVWMADSTTIQLLNGVDGGSVKVVGETSEGVLVSDKSNLHIVYLDSVTKMYLHPTLAVTNPLDIQQFEGFYLHHSTTLYFLDKRTVKVVAGVKPENLKSYGSCIGSNEQLICRGEIAPGIVANQLVRLGSSSSQYFKDATTVYYSLPAKLADAQASTFQLVDSSLSNFYATDGVKVWGGGKLMPTADPATFKVLNMLQAEDKGYTYSITFATAKK